MPRALLIKFGAIGDVIMAIPAAHQLHLAGHSIDWVCGPTVEPVLTCYPWINRIVADDRAIQLGTASEKAKALATLWRALAGTRYDLAATLYYDARYRLLASPVKATRKLMLSHTDRRFRLLPGRHHTDEYARILMGWPDEVRAQPLTPVPALNLPANPHARVAGRQRVILAPAGARNQMRDDALRRWPPESYVELAQLLLAEEIEVVLTGGPDDVWIKPYFASLNVTDLIAQHTLPQTLALLDAGDVVVTHDPGPLHLAGITSAGIVALFGPTDPRGRIPQRAGALALWGGEGFACRPCYDGHSFAPCPRNDCIRQWTPSNVAAQVSRMLSDRAQGILTAPTVLVPASTVPGARN